MNPEELEEYVARVETKVHHIAQAGLAIVEASKVILDRIDRLERQVAAMEAMFGGVRP